MNDIDIVLLANPSIRRKAQKISHEAIVGATDFPENVVRFFIQYGALLVLQEFEDKVPISRELYEFLQGAGELEGKWFEGSHYPPFWWRKNLRKALED